MQMNDMILVSVDHVCEPPDMWERHLSPKWKDRAPRFLTALDDTTLAGVSIPAGSIVMAVIGAANRDPHVFEDPDRLDLKRGNAQRNVAFGHGEHFCPGASLARAEASISFERLLTQLDDLQLIDPEALSYVETFIIRGLNDLPIRFRRRA